MVTETKYPRLIFSMVTRTKHPRPIFNMVTGTSPDYLPLLFSYNVYLGCVVLLRVHLKISTCKCFYVTVNMTSQHISIFLPRVSNSLYISVTIDFQIAISWYVLYSISLSAQVYVHIQSCNLFLHIKSYVPYCSVKPPHTGLCPPTAVLSHINSYTPILQC